MVFHPPKAKVGSAFWMVMVLFVAVSLLVVGLSIYLLQGTAALSYQITPDQVRITFGWKDTAIDRSAITDVRIIEEPSRRRRHVGTHLPGTLYEGRWSFDETGQITLFATSLQPLTVIETADGRWGISPADPHAFVHTVITEGVGDFPPQPAANTTGTALLTGVLIVLTVPLPVFLTIYIVRLARRLRYELTDDRLIIYGAWRSVTLAYETISSVRVASPKGRPWRTLGMSMPGLYWGSFAWKNAGPNLTLFATRLRPLVLINVGRRTYGLSPKDHELFVTQLTKYLEPQK